MSGRGRRLGGGAGPRRRRGAVLVAVWVWLAAAACSTAAGPSTGGGSSTAGGSSVVSGGVAEGWSEVFDVVFRRYRGGSGLWEVESFWHFAVPEGVSVGLGERAGVGDGGLVLELLDAGGAVLRRVGNQVPQPADEDEDQPEDLSVWFDGWDEQRFEAVVADAPDYAGYRIVEGSVVLVEVRRSVSAPVLDLGAAVRGDGAVELSLGLSDADGDDLSYVILDADADSGAWRLSGLGLWTQKEDLRQRFGGPAYRHPGAPAATGVHVMKPYDSTRWLVVASDGANWAAAASPVLSVPEPRPEPSSWELQVWLGADPWVIGGCDDPRGAVVGFGTFWPCDPQQPARGCIDWYELRSGYDYNSFDEPWFEELDFDHYLRSQVFESGEMIELTAIAFSGDSTSGSREGARGERCNRTTTGTKAVNVVAGEPVLWTSDIDGDLSALIRMPEGPGGRWLIDAADLTPGDHWLKAELVPLVPNAGIRSDGVYVRVRPPRGGDGVLRARDDDVGAYYSAWWARQRPGAAAVPAVVEVTANDTASGTGIAYRLTEVVHAPRWGTAEVAAGGRSVTYRADNFEPDPAGNFYGDGRGVGSDVFAYRICSTDPDPVCDTATVTVRLQVLHYGPATDPDPVAEPGPVAEAAPRRSAGPTGFDTMEDLPGTWIQQFELDSGSYPNMAPRLWHTLIPVKRLPGPQTLPADPQRRWALEFLDDRGDVVLSVPDNFGVFDPATADPPPYSSWRATDNGQVTFELARSPSRPDITLTAPEPGATIEGDITLEWTAQDPDGDLLSYMVFHSQDGGATYHRGPRYPWGGHHNRHPGLPQHRTSHTYRRTNPHDPATILPHGAEEARFLVIVTDGANWAAAESPTVTVAPMPPR